jgi:NADH-quinone oxidoreductase subunit F
MVDPHSLVEGVIISSFAIRSNFAVIYVRGEAVHAHRRLVAAVEEAYAAGYLGSDILGSGYDLELVVHAGAGAYICGEETALLDSLEGYRGQPRLKPPFPAVAGLYGAPTVINNVETLASVPFVVRGGAEWFKEFGPEKSPGPKIYSLSGRVVRPGQYEAPDGHDHARADRDGRRHPPRHELKFWTPGGSSTPYFTASTSTSRWTSTRWPPRAPCSAPPRSWSSTRPTRSSRPPCGSPSSTRTRAAASAPRAARAPTGWCRS